MAAKKFLIDIDLSKNQLLNAAVQNLGAHPSTPASGQIYWNTTDNKFYIYSVGTTSWIDLSTTGITNLSYNVDASTVTVVSDTGTNAVLQAASTVIAGIMTAADKLSLQNLVSYAVLDTDTSTTAMAFVIDEDTMVSDSNTKVPTQQSVKAYVDNAVTGGLTFEGDYNAATNLPDLDTLPSGVLQGHVYVVTADGTFFTEGVQAGDMLIAKQNDPTTLAHWSVVNKNIPTIVDASTTAKGLIELATQVEVDAGTDIERAVTPKTLKDHLGIVPGLSTVLTFNELVGTGAATAIAVTHNLNNQFVTVQVIDVSTTDVIECEVELTSTAVVTLRFNVAPTANQYRVIIQG